MDKLQHQKSFFEYLHHVTGYERTDQFAECIAQALGISRSGAYKKVKGISKLTLDEAVTITQTLGVSINQYLEKLGASRSGYIFQSNDVVHSIDSYTQWADNIYDHGIALEKLRPNYKVYSFSNEVSVFQYIGFHYLLSFKLYVWHRNNWQIKGLGDQYDFNIYNNDRALHKSLQKVSDHYTSYESVEVWSFDFLSNILSQLLYYTKLGKVSQQDAQYILDDIKKLISHLFKQAELGMKKKFGNKQNGAKLEIYLNYTHTNPELLYITSDELDMVYTQYLSPNYLRTKDQRICQYTKKWMDSAISQSSKISGVGEIEREKALRNILEIVDKYEALLALAHI